MRLREVKKMVPPRKWSGQDVQVSRLMTQSWVTILQAAILCCHFVAQYFSLTLCCLQDQCQIHLLGSQLSILLLHSSVSSMSPPLSALVPTTSTAQLPLNLPDQALLPAKQIPSHMYAVPHLVSACVTSFTQMPLLPLACLIPACSTKPTHSPLL